MVAQLKPIAARVGAAAPVYADGARYVLGPGVAAAGQVVNDARVTDHHAIIPTDGEHDLAGLGRDERRVYDLVARRFLAVFHPAAQVRAHRRRDPLRGPPVPQPRQGPDRGRVAGGLRRGVRRTSGPRTARRSASRPLPALSQGQAVDCTEVEALAKQTKPPGRYSEGTLLRAMETAGKLVDDDEAAEAMKDAGLGTPATRAATIERLIDAGYIEREGRQLRATEKGVGLIQMLGDHLLTRPELTGRWEQRLNRIERGEAAPRGLPPRDRGLHPRRGRPGSRTRTARTCASSAASWPRAPLPGCAGHIVEYPKSYGCNSYRSKDEPGCGYTLWKQMNGRSITLEEAREHIAAGRSSKDLVTERETLGPCPTPGCPGHIVERTRSYGCTSWKSRNEPGCGYVIWKKVRGRPQEVDVEAARRMVAAGETNAQPAASAEPLGACPTPGCGGQIVENSRAYGCTSWKSRSNPGCGFVIWKREKGHDVTRDEAKERLAEAQANPPAPAPARPAPARRRRATTPAR